MSAASCEACSRGWQPIATAPHDGTKIIAFALRDGAPTIKINWWRRREDKAEYIGWGEFNATFWPPTHWIPLPAPPTTRALSPQQPSLLHHDGLNRQARNPVRLPDGSGDLASAGSIAGNDITDPRRQVGKPHDDPTTKTDHGAGR